MPTMFDNETTCCVTEAVSKIAYGSMRVQKCLLNNIGWIELTSESLIKLHSRKQPQVAAKPVRPLVN